MGSFDYILCMIYLNTFQDDQTNTSAKTTSLEDTLLLHQLRVHMVQGCAVQYVCDKESFVYTSSHLYSIHEQ